MHACMYMCICIYICIHPHLNLNLQTCIGMYAFLYTQTHARAHTHTQTHIVVSWEMYDPRVEFTLPCILYSIEAILNLQSCLACLFALIVWLVIVSCPERLSCFCKEWLTHCSDTVAANKEQLYTCQTQLQQP